MYIYIYCKDELAYEDQSSQQHAESNRSHFLTAVQFKTKYAKSM